MVLKGGDMRRRGYRDLELALLRTFLALIEHRNMRKTAQALSMTQPAVSAQMARLAKIVGHKLFTPCPTGVELTRHGEMLICYAEQALRLSEKALAHLRGDRELRQLVIGMTSDVALFGVVEAIKALHVLHPAPEIKVVFSPADHLDALLGSAKVDVAVADPATMKCVPEAIWQVPLRWAACRDFELQPSRPLPLVTFDEPYSWQQQMLAGLDSAGLHWGVVFQSASLDAIVAAVQSKLGIAALPQSLIADRGLQEVRHRMLPAPPEAEFGLYRSTSSKTAELIAG